jgi:hypothetical protein
VCTLFLSYKYARCESQQRRLDTSEYSRSCVIPAHVNVVLFLSKNSLCTGVINSRPRTHIIFNPNKLCTPSHQKNYDLSNIQDTPTNSHTWLIKQIILHIMGEKKGVWFEAAPPRTSHESLLERSTPKHPPNPTTHYKPMPNYTLQADPQLHTTSRCPTLWSWYAWSLPKILQNKIARGELRPPTCCRCGQFSD